MEGERRQEWRDRKNIYVFRLCSVERYKVELVRQMHMEGALGMQELKLEQKENGKRWE